ncbi:MAG: thiamine phosphate synthase [Burkholderiales bacterium]
MNDRTSLPQPLVWAVAGARNTAATPADRRAFDAFAVQGCVATARGAASNTAGSSPLEPSRPTLAVQLDALMKGPQPASIKTSLPSDTAELQDLMQCIDRLRVQHPLLAVVVDAQAAVADRGLLDTCITGLLPRATLVTLSPADASKLLGCPPLLHDTDIEDAARGLQMLTGCRGVVIHKIDMSGVCPDGAFMLTEQASGWLLPMPAAGAAATSLPVAACDDHRACFSASAAAAFARGFVAADAVVLAHMAATHFQRHRQHTDESAASTNADQRFALERANLPALRSSSSAPPISFAPLVQPQMGLYAVVDSAAWVQRVLDSGVRTVQLRIKDPAHPKLREEIKQAVAAASAVDAQFFINDHWQLAIEENAYGVHLGQEDLATVDLPRLAAAGVRLGISTHAYWEVCRAAALQPSYIACGPIHPTAAKAMPWIPQGNDNLAYWCALLREPVVAIAGMDFERAAQAVQRGADAVAVISGITAAHSPEQAIQSFDQSIAQARQFPRQAPPDMPRPTLARKP